MSIAVDLSFIVLELEELIPFGVLYVLTHDDVVGNAFTEYAADTTTAGSSVVTGWNTIEVYIKRPANRADITTGRTWAAITPDSTHVRTKIIDQVGGIQMGADELPMNRIILGNCYCDSTTIDATHNVTMGAFEIWDHLPSTVFAPT